MVPAHVAEMVPMSRKRRHRLQYWSSLPDSLHPRKVYIVFYRAYGDNYITRVFDSKEMADGYAAGMNMQSEPCTYEVEEHEVTSDENMAGQGKVFTTGG
jgi:hypothetical protein